MDKLYNLRKLKIIWIRHFIWEELSKKMQEKWYDQAKLWNIVWAEQSYISQVVNWKTWNSDLYINLFQVIWVSEREIIDIYKKAFEKEKRIIFWNDEKIEQKQEEITEAQINELKENFMNEMALSRKFRNDDEALEEARKIWEFMVDEAVKIKKFKK